MTDDKIPQVIVGLPVVVVEVKKGFEKVDEGSTVGNTAYLSLV